MENQSENLNTESNDIAGNRIDGPVGNTAAKPMQAGTGIPGGSTPAPAPDTSSPAAPASSESLADSETSVGQGAVEPAARPQENKEASPDDLQPADTYGGNFGNSTQNSYRDEDRRENQDSDANRGEFGAQDLGGTTHGGFGNQNRLADYEPRDSAEDQYYGGAGRHGPQQNAYRAYDGRDARPDSQTEYGFEAGHDDRVVQPNPSAAQRNDNGSPIGPDSGYAADYGQTSLRGASPQRQNAPGAGGRNQSEDYLPTPGGFDHQGREEAQSSYSTNGPEMANRRAPHPASDEAGRAANAETRDGYVRAEGGDSAQGLGSRGGSYNDAYDDSQPGSTAGSPAQGDQRREDTAGNYGEAARKENRASDEENDADHGAPQRNAGREE